MCPKATGLGAGKSCSGREAAGFSGQQVLPTLSCTGSSVQTLSSPLPFNPHPGRYVGCVVAWCGVPCWLGPLLVGHTLTHIPGLYQLGGSRDPCFSGSAGTLRENHSTAELRPEKSVSSRNRFARHPAWPASLGPPRHTGCEQPQGRERRAQLSATITGTRGGGWN